MPESTTSLILSELRDLREELNQFTRSSEGRLATLETGMYDLRGNGQPGRVTKLEHNVHELDRWKYKLVGYSSGIAACVSVIGWCVEHLVK
ncbi:MAG: hypothetical protein PW792_08285 [Acidobacteriaceae bacterium]|nr:hypothetical protein [Acidobacteriaceae bacterium]